ncbi:Retinol dehydrogenase 5 [Boothiomyces macroporosus]|uniref:Retinol dehydrogenase 5 n=1 Tax=Boothiomyces macroporosus TaxID=261099 RepID=A0AAD5UGY6_9FUNG|nr:Retinol dehydrogenase 5 [Boothiomyces macroporosus]
MNTGFGNLTAISLAKEGYPVIATCLLPDSVKELESLDIPNLTPIKMDVTSQQDIDSVFDYVQEKHASLYGLINNAGINHGFYLELTNIDHYTNTFNVNYFGVVRCCKTFLPLLRKTKNARIINISTQGIFMPVPGSSSYCSSKSAMKTFSDCLRMELLHTGVSVTVITPGVYATPLLDRRKHAEEIFDSLTQEQRATFGEDQIEHYRGFFNKGPRAAAKPENCVKQIVKVSTAKRPPMERLIGYDSYLFWYFYYILPTFVKVLIFRVVWFILFLVIGKNKRK